MAVTVEELMATLGLNNTQFIAALNQSANQTGEFSKKMGHMHQSASSGFDNLSMQLGNIGMSMQTLGRTLSMYITAPIVGLGIISAKTAMDIESQWKQVQKVYDGTAASIKNEISPAVSKLSKKFGVQKTETLDATAALAAMGYQGSSLIDTLTKSMEFATLGDINLTQAMESTVAVSKIYNKQGQGLKETLSSLNTVENISAATMDDLTWGIREAGSVGKLAGVSIEELSSMMAVLRERAVPASEAAFALKSIFTRIRNPSKDAKEILDKFNISISDSSGKMVEADIIMQKIAGSWGKMTEKEREQLSTELIGIHQKGRFVSLIDDLTGSNSTYMKTMAGVGNTTQNLSGYEKELAIALEQSKIKYERMKIRLGEIAEIIGARILPVAISWGEKLAGWLEKFNKLNPSMQNFIIIIGAIAAGIGPVLIFLGTLISSFGQVLQMFSFIAAHPIVLIIGAIALAFAAAAYLIYQNWDKFAPYFEEIKNVVINFVNAAKPVIQSIADWFKEKFNQIQTIITNVFNFIWPFISGILTTIGSFIQSKLERITSWVQLNWTLIQQTISTVMTFIQGIISTAMNFIQGIISTVLGVIVGFWTAHGETIKIVISTAWEIIQTVISTAINAVLGIIRMVMQIITGDWSGAWETLKSILGGVLDGILSVMKSLISGAGAVIKDVASTIISNISSVPAKMISIGRSIIEGLWNGIKAMGHWLASRIGEFIKSNIPAVVKNALGIKSPSSVMRGYGMNIARGLAEGIISGASLVSSATDKLNFSAQGNYGANFNGLNPAMAMGQTQNNSSVNLTFGNIYLGGNSSNPKQQANDFISEIQKQITKANIRI